MSAPLARASWNAYVLFSDAEWCSLMRQRGVDLSRKVRYERSGDDVLVYDAEPRYRQVRV